MTARLEHEGIQYKAQTVAGACTRCSEAIPMASRSSSNSNRSEKTRALRNQPTTCHRRCETIYPRTRRILAARRSIRRIMLTATKLTSRSARSAFAWAAVKRAAKYETRASRLSTQTTDETRIQEILVFSLAPICSTSPTPSSRDPARPS